MVPASSYNWGRTVTRRSDLKKKKKTVNFFGYINWKLHQCFPWWSLFIVFNWCSKRAFFFFVKVWRTITLCTMKMQRKVLSLHQQASFNIFEVWQLVELVVELVLFIERWLLGIPACIRICSCVWIKHRHHNHDHSMFTWSTLFLYNRGFKGHTTWACLLSQK